MKKEEMLERLEALRLNIDALPWRLGGNLLIDEAISLARQLDSNDELIAWCQKRISEARKGVYVLDENIFKRDAEIATLEVVLQKLRAEIEEG